MFADLVGIQVSNQAVEILHVGTGHSIEEVSLRKLGGGGESARPYIGLWGVRNGAGVGGVDHDEHVASDVDKLVGVCAVSVCDVRHKSKPLQDCLLKEVHATSPGVRRELCEGL